MARSAISRFYYSTYHQAKEWADRHHYDKSADKFSFHMSLWIFMRDKTGIQTFYSHGYETCHDDRVQADYSLEVDYDERSFDAAWDNIERLHQFLSAMPVTWPTDPALRTDASRALHKKARELDL